MLQKHCRITDSVWKGEGVILLKDIIRRFMAAQKKYSFRLKQKEQEENMSETARQIFKEKPYYMRYMKQDRCGNSLGGRE